MASRFQIRKNGFKLIMENVSIITENVKSKQCDIVVQCKLLIWAGSF